MNLPDDVIWCLFEKVSHYEDCLALARTCRQYWNIWAEFRKNMIVYIEQSGQYKYKLKSVEINLYSKKSDQCTSRYVIIFRAKPSPCDTALEITFHDEINVTLNKVSKVMGHKHCDAENEHNCNICSYFSLQFIKSAISPILFSPVFPLFARERILSIFDSKVALSWTRLFLWSDRSPEVWNMFFARIWAYFGPFRAPD